MKSIGKWIITEVHISHTYGSIFEGNPRDSHLKEIILRPICKNLKSSVNFINEENKNGCLKQYILKFSLSDYDDEMADFVVLVDEVDNITDTISKILEENPNFKKEKFVW